MQSQAEEHPASQRCTLPATNKPKQDTARLASIGVGRRSDLHGLPVHHVTMFHLASLGEYQDGEILWTFSAEKEQPNASKFGSKLDGSAPSKHHRDRASYPAPATKWQPSSGRKVTETELGVAPGATSIADPGEAARITGQQATTTCLMINCRLHMGCINQIMTKYGLKRYCEI